MTIKSRLKKLEAKSPEVLDPPILFYQFCRIKKGTEETTRVIEREPGPATIPGLGLGRIFPNEGESQSEFERRVFAIKAGGKFIEDMDEEELAAAYAIADQKLKNCDEDT